MIITQPLVYQESKQSSRNLFSLLHNFEFVLKAYVITLIYVRLRSCGRLSSLLQRRLIVVPTTYEKEVYFHIGL